MKMRNREMVPCRAHLAVRLAVTCFVICSNIAMADLNIGFCFRQRTPIGNKGGKCQGLLESLAGSAADECCSQGGIGWAERINGKKCLDPCEGKMQMPPGEERTTQDISVHGQWGEWSEWSECSATCGETMTRQRECDSPRPEHGGYDCTGDYREVAWCNNRRNCPIHGGWRAWGSWSPCSASCGRQGTQKRYHSCTDPKPEYGGRDCEGDVNAQRPCSGNRKCPIDGGWGKWNEWHCGEECKQGDGRTWRTRFCNNPFPRHDGNQCEGDRLQRALCSDATCAVNGGWSEWSSWSECSSSCGSNGFKSRKRQCNNPVPGFGGYQCHGNKTEGKSCGNDPCQYTSEDEPSQWPGMESGAPCDDEDLTEGGSGCRLPGSGDGSSDVQSRSESELIPDYVTEIDPYT